ncbi:hypothetical protein [Roseburia intestinalis]|uniref:hypothetical protein n=1 Tax=Roseburia intestinalis TaxID=166486 RepID=UPI0018A0F1AD|nr:hypothetical protein [Roseburia intestinalis]
MTENEALEYLKSSKRKNDMLGILPGSDIGNTIIKALEELKQYRTIGTVEECRAAVEKQTAISRELIEGKYFCPKCHNLMPYPGYCGCGQKVY